MPREPLRKEKTYEYYLTNTTRGEGEIPGGRRRRGARREADERGAEHGMMRRGQRRMRVGRKQDDDRTNGGRAWWHRAAAWGGTRAESQGLCECGVGRELVDERCDVCGVTGDSAQTNRGDQLLAASERRACRCRAV